LKSDLFFNEHHFKNVFEDEENDYYLEIAEIENMNETESDECEQQEEDEGD